MIMYDPYTLDRIHAEQSKRSRTVADPRPTRARAAASRRIARAELAWLRTAPATD
jgi:hypothetical protein